MNSEAHRHVIGKIVLFQFSTLQRELQSTRNIYIYMTNWIYPWKQQFFSPLYPSTDLGAFSPRANQSSRLPLILRYICVERNSTRRFSVIRESTNRIYEVVSSFWAKRSRSRRTLVPRCLVISNTRYRSDRLCYSTELVHWRRLL